MNIWLKSSIIALIATSVSYVVSHMMGWTDSLNWLEVSAVFTSYMCTFMCVHQTRWNYPIGVLTTFLYSWLFYQWEMYGVAVFNLYLVFSLTYGWFRWGPDTNTRPISRVHGGWWLGYIGIGAGIYGLLWAVNTYFNITMSLTEIYIVVLSGVAQFLLDNKKLENWFVWIVVNILSIHFYFQGGLYLVAFQYLFFLGNAFYGLWTWWKHSNHLEEVK